MLFDKKRLAVTAFIPLVAAGLLTAPAAPASAESVTGSTERGIDGLLSGNGPWCYIWEISGPCFLDPVDRVLLPMAFNAETTALAETDWAIDQALYADKTDPATWAGGLVGHAVNQAETLAGLLGLYVNVSVVSSTPGVHVQYYGPGGPVDKYVGVSQPDPFNLPNPTGCLPPSCTPVTALAQNQPAPNGGQDDAVSNFSWRSNYTMYHNPNDSSGGPGKVDGRINYNFYRTTGKPRQEWDFFATSMAYSVTPINGHRLKEMVSHISPRGDLEPVDADPLAVNKFGSAGSWSLGASLMGEAKMGNYGGGGSFSIGRTWNYPEGYGGGGQLSSGEHYAMWKTGSGSGSTYAKSTAGVETWKRPTGGAAGYAIWSGVTVK